MRTTTTTTTTTNRMAESSWVEASLARLKIVFDVSWTRLCVRACSSCAGCRRLANALCAVVSAILIVVVFTGFSFALFVALVTAVLTDSSAHC